MDERRSRETRARAELALVRLLHEPGDDDVFLVVFGGLVPELLVRDDDLIPAHLGTTDVDILLIAQVEPDADLGGVERALERMNFEPDPTEASWSWRGAVEGWPVKLEFLCDLPDQREEKMIRARGCTNLAAANLRGTGYVARDFAWGELSGTMVDGTQVTGRARFAGLEGYLLSKCVALRTRAATNDYLRPGVRAPAQPGRRPRAGSPSACSTAGSRTHLDRCARPFSRSGHATPRRLTAGRAAMPSRRSRLTRTLTQRCCERTPSTSCNGSSRYSASENGRRV